MYKIKMTYIVLCFVLFSFLLTPFTQVYAQGQSNTGQTVTITYDQALRMALNDTLTAREFNIQIRNMQMRRNDLNEEIRRNESNRRNAQNNATNSLFEGIWELDMAIWGIHSEMSMMEWSIEFHMGQLLLGLETGDLMLVAEALPAVMFAISSLTAMSGHIAAMEAQRSLVFDEIWRLQDEAVQQQNRNAERETRNSLNETQRQTDILNHHQAQHNIMIELLLRSLIVELAESALFISMFKAEHEFAEEDLRRLTLAHELGFVSIHDLRMAENNLAQGRIGLEGLIRNQQAIRQDLNHLLGQPLSQHTVIRYNRVLPELPQNLTRHIDSVIARDPAIRILQIEIDSARGERWVYTGNNNDIRISDSDRRRVMTALGSNSGTSDNDILTSRNRIALQDAVDLAVLRKEQAVRTMEAAMFRGYLDLEGLFGLEAILRFNLSQARTALGFVQSNVQLGYATRLDVEAARLVILRIEQDIELVQNNIWILAFMLENPSLFR